MGIMRVAIKLLAYPNSKARSTWIKELAEDINKIECITKRKADCAKIKKWLYEERDAQSHYLSVVEDIEESAPARSFSQIEQNLNDFYDITSKVIAENCKRQTPHKIDAGEIIRSIRR